MQLELSPTAFGIIVGVLATLTFGGLVAIVIAYKRHSCKFCGHRTRKVIRLRKLPITPNTLRGTMPVEVFRFRICESNERHVTLSMKYVYMTREELDHVPVNFLDGITLSDHCSILGIRLQKHRPFMTECRFDHADN